jgi:uncharacterized protein (DUF1786 family)
MDAHSKSLLQNTLGNLNRLVNRVYQIQSIKIVIIHTGFEGWISFSIQYIYHARRHALTEKRALGNCGGRQHSRGVINAPGQFTPSIASSTGNPHRREMSRYQKRYASFRIRGMKILAVDIGTGTQDILLFDPDLDIENSFKMVLPSPTMIVRDKIRRATRSAKPVVLTGVMMGGGPCAWAAEDHLKAGYKLFATPEAASTMNDDLDAVSGMGVFLISEDEARRLPDEFERIELRDFDFQAISDAFAEFGVELAQDQLGAVAAAVFDHGAAPPEISDRAFRFDYLDRRIRDFNRLSAFAYPADEIPAIMTRLQAVSMSAHDIPAPLVMMDTAPAAVLGATFDTVAGNLERALYVNVGNFHTIAFRLGPGGIEGVFEHHTGLLDQYKLEHLLRALARGSLTNDEVFSAMGHGALVYDPTPFALEGTGIRVVVTGPRRNLLAGSELRPHFAVPFGDMMIAGCFGLLAAAAEKIPALETPILAGLTRRGGLGRPPWENET